MATITVDHKSDPSAPVPFYTIPVGDVIIVPGNGAVGIKTSTTTILFVGAPADGRLDHPREARDVPASKEYFVARTATLTVTR